MQMYTINITRHSIKNNIIFNCGIMTDINHYQKFTKY